MSVEEIEKQADFWDSLYEKKTGRIKITKAKRKFQKYDKYGIKPKKK